MIHDRIEEALEIFGLSEILEMHDISEYEVLDILIRHGYIEINDELPYQEQEDS